MSRSQRSVNSCPVVVNDLGVHAEIGHHTEFGIRIVVNVGGSEPAVVAVPVVLQLHLGFPGGSVEDEDAIVGSHDDIELAIDIDVNYEDIGVPSVGKGFRLPHYPRLAAVVREQPAVLGIGPAVAERVSHFKALQAFYPGQDLGHFEDIVHRHDHLAAAEVEDLRPDPPSPSLGADVPRIYRGGKGQGDRVVALVLDSTST